MKKTLMAGLLGGALLTAGILGFADTLAPTAQPGVTTAPPATPAAVTQAGTAHPGDSAQVARGRYIAASADCIACHTALKSGQPFAGGYALETPFGKIVASNITQDKATGIGNWSEAEFIRAVRLGKGKQGENLYPAMPYTAYVKMSDADMHDLWAFMQTVKPVSKQVESNQLPFPFNIRLLMAGWNLLFFDNAPFKEDPAHSVEWNRGAYLVEGAGHCAACHSGKNFLGGDKALLQGGVLQGWYAPEITGDKRLGIGGWSQAELVQYLQIGSNDHAVAAGPMAEAVSNSTQYMTSADLNAIAVFLNSVPGSGRAKAAPLAATDPAMQRGGHLYQANCAACHDASGAGVSTMVSSLANSPSLQAPYTESLVHTVLTGERGAVTVANPTGAAMPAFGWKLTDSDIAAVLTYARNSWGNAAAPVTADSVAKARTSLKAQTPTLAAAAN